MEKLTPDGIELIRSRLRDLPVGPGVYRMLNADGAVLYVGKARNLKARVTQYTQTERMSVRIRKMVFETCDLVIVETRSEAEALLLEANLIKSLKPKYNIIFRDDASYVSVVITDDETPLIRSHRGARRKGGEYFGPYPSASAVYATLDLMERAFRLRTCAASVFAHRSRPCLKYDIKRCSGPCVGKISAVDYAATVREAKRFLRGERGRVLAELQAQMEAASAQLDYEKAALMRDRIKALSAVATASTALTHALDDADVLALVQEGGRWVVQAFYYRNGQHVGNEVYYPKGDEEEPAEMFRVFMALHYTQRQLPLLIVTNIEPAESSMLAEALGISAGRKVRLETPMRGEKREIALQAEANARAALRRKSLEQNGWAMHMDELASMLGFDRVLESVECFDISNISGKFPVASCVVAGREGMLRQRYRTYKVTSKDTPDDYAMMREILARRIARGGLPDVLLVDGGKGQLNVLRDVAREAGLLGRPECPALVGIAKGEERDKGLETLFVAEGEVEVHQLPVAHGSGLIFMLQRIRDEAHRFAIGFHRKVRSGAIKSSKLDGITGVGAAKKKALLRHFGSLDGVRNATEAELAAVPGIGPVLADIIYKALQVS